MSEGLMHQRWFQKAFGGVLCIFTNFVLMSGVQDSGKLQLVDATGALDVMIPDLQCLANLSSTYQVAAFQPILWFPSLSPYV